MENLDWNHVISACLGGSSVSFMVRLVIRRVLSKFDEALAKLEATSERLIVLETKLGSLGILEANVARHDRALAELEIKVATRRRSYLLSREQSHGAV